MAEQTERQQQGIACEECRRKRTRCDRKKPCMACTASGTKCVVRDSCPARGPKKGYLKTLQKKIDDLEAQLGNQQRATSSAAETRASSPSPGAGGGDHEYVKSHKKEHSISTATDVADSMLQWPETMEFPIPIMPTETFGLPETSYDSSQFYSLDNWENFDNCQKFVPIPTQFDPLVTPMMHNDLDQLYFDRAYAFAPIVHAHRYRCWSKQPNKSKQKTCLQYAMWTLASSLSSQFQVDGRTLYAKTRQLLHGLELEETCNQISLEQAQAWTLLSLYELTRHDFHLGMISAGRAFRLIQMMRLYELDECQTSGSMQLVQLQGQHLLPGSVQEDWIDTETKRRTFWLAYTIDRFTSMVNGLHMFFDERLIRTRLPAPEMNFATNRPAEMNFLRDTITVVGLNLPHVNLSPFAESVIGASICGRVLEHKQKPPMKACPEFCRRHRSLHILLLQRIRTLRVSGSLDYQDPILAFVALATQTAVLMLYDLLESRPLGSDVQGTQLSQALQTEHTQHSLDAVADIALLIAVLDQQYQMHPLTPFLLLLGAQFSRSYPGLNDAYIKLLPGITTILQASTGVNHLVQNVLQVSEPSYDNFFDFT